MSTQRAWQFTERGLLSKTAKLVNIEKPSIKSDQLLVKIHAVALNPVDDQLSVNKASFRLFSGGADKRSS
jgi:NADPH:quinone reductase-like Zn-dependent oxidoreductase